MGGPVREPQAPRPCRRRCPGADLAAGPRAALLLRGARGRAAARAVRPLPCRRQFRGTAMDEPHARSRLRPAPRPLFRVSHAANHDHVVRSARRVRLAAASLRAGAVGRGSRAGGGAAVGRCRRDVGGNGRRPGFVDAGRVGLGADATRRSPNRIGWAKHRLKGVPKGAMRAAAPPKGALRRSPARRPGRSSLPGDNDFPVFRSASHSEHAGWLHARS